MTGFKSVHPLVLFFFYGCVFSISLACSHPAVLLTSFFCSLFYDIFLRRKKALKFFFFFLFPLMILITALNVLFSHRGVTALFELKSGNFLTLESLVYGFAFSLRAVCAMLWLDCFNETTNEEMFVYLFARISPRLSLLLSMVLRFVPLLRSESEKIRQARLSLGFASKSEKLSKRFKNSLRESSILITRALENAAFTSDSMTARGYGTGRRTFYNPYKFSKRDGVLLALFASFVCLFLFAKSTLYAVYIPVITISKPNFLGIVTIVFFFAICLCGFAVDIGEEHLWRKSK